jgi:UDP:flavonoid glycosyltransferase YjiC (YdhE family)
MANVLLLTWGSGGDIAPMMQIGQGLRARGHEVTLITSYNYAERARQAGLRFAALHSSEEAERFLQDVDRLARPIEFIRHFRQHLLPRIPHEYAVIRQHYRPGDTILVCLDITRPTGQLSAEKLSIPFVLFYSNPKHVEFRFGRFATTQASLDRSDSFGAEIRAVLGLPPVEDPQVWERGLACRLGHWPEWFAPLGEELPFAVTPIGFIFDRSSDPLPAEVQAFLEAGPPPVLITHGTSLPKDPAFFHASAAACQRLGQRALLDTGHAALVPEPLPASVAWFRYAPYGNLMPHMRAIIHHGGVGTVGAALLAGIPQLLLPAGHDRRDNALNVRRLGVGDLLPPPQWRAERIAEVLGRLLDSPSVQARCQELAGWMRQLDPVATACDLIEAVLAGQHAAESAAAAQVQQASEVVILENGRDAELSQRLSHLSPEKRALLAARLRRQTGHDDQMTR